MSEDMHTAAVHGLAESVAGYDRVSAELDAHWNDDQSGPLRLELHRATQRVLADARIVVRRAELMRLWSGRSV